MLDATEAITNAIVGYMVSVSATYLLLPLWGVVPSVSASFGISAMFFCVSFVRAYLLRKLFRRLERDRD